MNTKNLKAYAPKARRQFMEAVAKRAAHFGIYEDEIAPVSFQGSTAIIEGNAFTKQQGEQRKRLEKRIEEKPVATHKERFDLFVREMAYTWFNRLAALRYMELHDYFEHGFRVLSHPTNQYGLPEILDHAADVADMLGLNKAQIIEWQLAGDKQELLYRELLLGQCHHLHNVMPFLFEAIDDATELLLPDNLTKTDSILKGLINDIPEEDWEQIEVIGWLYQFYISEHKDAVIGKIVKSEDIPAATQLFTPNWIVKYLVHNSIGRQWLATYPDSSIKAKMEYYIEPAAQTDEVNTQIAAITPSSIDPESIKALDPACGSGHILVEMYELLREIYLERGYRLREIPELILTQNIYGLDIDDRAAQLAGFALLMKAREDDRRIFQRVQDGSVKLNVYALQSTEGWDSASLWQALNLDGKAKQGSSGDLFIETKKFDAPTGEYAEYFDLLKYLIMSFEQAKTFGSLIQIDHQYLTVLSKLKAKLLDKLHDTDPAANAAACHVLPMIEQAIVLAEKYDAIIANPPYLGSKGMNQALKAFAKEVFPDSKTDLFAMFIQRGFDWLKRGGFNSMVTMQSWMFLSSFERMRHYILSNTTIENMVHMGNGVMKIAFGTNATVFRNNASPKFLAKFSYIINEDISKAGIPREFPIKNDRLKTASAKTFSKIPGSPIAYWLEPSIADLFIKTPPLDSEFDVKAGMASSDNDRFLRFWFEVSIDNVCLNSDSVSAQKSKAKWFPYNKGGSFRKWFGNSEYVINWMNEGQEIKEWVVNNPNDPNTNHWSRRIANVDIFFKHGITWGEITSGKPSFRYLPQGYIIGNKGPLILEGDFSSLGILNSNLMNYIISLINPTITLGCKNVGNLPNFSSLLPKKDLENNVKECVEIAKEDCNSSEVSWDFRSFDVISHDFSTIKESVFAHLNYWKNKSQRMLEIEESLNSNIQDVVSLGDLSLSNINIDDVSLSRNIFFRFEQQRDSAYLDKMYESELTCELTSIVIGMMMGRYSLDRQGLVYACSGNNGFKELVEEGAYQTFPADDDGIIPLASEEWLFEDDATTRFREFIKTVWGEERLQENLVFVAESLCLRAIRSRKGESAMESIRRYFSTQFFADHCKMYKKRPIYWLFSSGKEKAFECLVYLHRYNEATLSRMRTEYVTPLMGKYEHQLARKMDEVVEATGTEQRRIEKEIKDLEKKQAELRKFDEELKHYAEMRISLDLDDGVKANYGKFGNLLANVKAIHGKAVK